MVLPKSSVSGKKFQYPGDPFLEINSASFLNAVRTGNPGCERAFGRLFNQTHAQLKSYVHRYFPDSSVVEDILQETYFAVHRGLPRFEGRCKLSTWIFSLAYHKVCDKLAEKYHEAYSRPVPTGILESIESREPLPDSVLIQSDLVRMVEFAAAELVGKYRDVHYLRDCEGLSGEETALALGIKNALVRVRLHRARCFIVEKIRARFPQAILENNVR